MPDRISGMKIELFIIHCIALYYLARPNNDINLSPPPPPTFLLLWNQMISEIEEFDEQLQDLVSGIRTVLEREIPNLRGQERIERCSYLRNRINRSKQVLRSILVEIRDLPDEKVPDWETRAKDYETQIARLLQDVEWSENSARGDAASGSKKKTVDEMTAKELTTQAIELQQDTKAATSRIIQVVEETQQIGAAAADELKHQGDQIKNIAEGIEQVESNLKRADKQLRVFMRRMATDKIFLLFIFLIVIGIIVAIVLYILKKKAGLKI